MKIIIALHNLLIKVAQASNIMIFEMSNLDRWKVQEYDNYI